MEIRPERSEDYERIDEVVGAAFTHDPAVVPLVKLLRASDAYVPELALVAVDGEDVVGHILFTYATLRREHDELRVLLLSPLAVWPARQKGGIGTALVREGLACAEARGEPLVIVEGIPAYYPQFGFERALALGIEPPSAHIPDAAWMAKRLSKYDASLRGTVVYDAAFDAVAELSR